MSTSSHCSGETLNARVLRADGLEIAPLLDVILPLFKLDAYVPDPIVMMDAVEGDSLDPAVGKRNLEAIRRHTPKAPEPPLINRFAFHERAKPAFAGVVTGELAKYGNIILKKGVTPLPPPRFPRKPGLFEIGKAVSR